jgi:TonB family protein
MIRQLLLAALVLTPASMVFSAHNPESDPAKDLLACPAEAGPPTQAPHKWVFVSGGVMARNRMGGKDPKYPGDAKKAHVEGRVVIKVTVSDAGKVENACVLYGPEMLQQAAIDAVRTWTYKPFELNGEPREVKSQLNIDFTLTR